MTRLRLSARRLVGAAIVTAALVNSLPALAAPSTPEPQMSADYQAGKKALEAKNFAAAVPLLQKALSAESKNADILNDLGFAHRNLGNLDRAQKYYDDALAIDPKHRSANEYLGELHLMRGDLARAEERLRVLDKACIFGCPEYDDLKKAIAAYKAKKK